MMGRILYGAFFVIGLPALLALWAWRLEPEVTLPLVEHFWIGLALAVFGLGLIGAGMWALWGHGGGLPMNAYPPPRLVERGIYWFISQPIYVGFVIVCVGVSVAAGSRAGLWVVAPLAGLGCAALVLGYERHDLLRRFGTLPRPLIRWPSGGPETPVAWERASVYLMGLLPGLLAYTALELMRPRETDPTLLAISGAFLAIAPLAAGTREVLRRFAVAALAATVLGGLWTGVIPLSFPVCWVFLAAWVFFRRWPRWGWLAWVAAAVFAGISLVVESRDVADVGGGLLLFGISLWVPEYWGVLLKFTEAVANSWREWRVGPVRVINHGAFAGLAALVGLGGAAVLAGSGNIGSLVIVALCSLAGSGLWGQLLVGSGTLLRPFGYYGGVLGAAAGLVLILTLGADFWLLAAALAVMGPWVQLCGRFRCLVQGCCHGAPTGSGWGIRYERPESRVCRIASLKGVPVHPTPLYSMLANVVIGVVLAKLWGAGASLTLIVGLYLMLAGLARFAEESYRGEPQTPVVRGLRLYQWFALASVAAGAVVTTLRADSRTPAPEPTWAALAAGVGVGLAYWFAMGVDFPSSNWRFSRLT